MSLLPQPLETRLASTPRVLLVGAGGADDLALGMVLFFALEARGHRVRLASVSHASSDAAHERAVVAGIDEHLAQLGREARVASVAAEASAIGALVAGQAEQGDLVMLVAGGGALLASAGGGASLGHAQRRALAAFLEHAAPVVALVALGAEVSEGLGADETARALSRHLAAGALLAAEAIHPHAGPTQDWLELVEHLHHRMGPAAKSAAVGTLRAALFGRHGALPVSLATAAKERRPWVSASSTLIHYLDGRELMR